MNENKGSKWQTVCEEFLQLGGDPMFQINSKEVLSGRDLAANPLTMRSFLMLIGSSAEQNSILETGCWHPIC
jgi:hypothetical protein